MGAITRSAAALIIAAVTVLGVNATADASSTAPGPRANSDTSTWPPTPIVCADSMVWDGHKCVWIGG
jgi:hypothetical protein